MNDKKETVIKEHRLVIEGREKLNISGVDDIGSFNDNTVVISTQLGDLILKGSDLHISSLDVNEGNAIIQGYIISCVYTEGLARKKEKGLFKNIFK